MMGDDMCVVKNNPCADTVWTGSYNCSKTAENSFENAVILKGEEIATAYLLEFALLFLLSEKLDWTSDRMMPYFSYQS